jgi:hypothetical protein
MGTLRFYELMKSKSKSKSGSKSNKHGTYP